jgi:hypothetical protein
MINKITPHRYLKNTGELYRIYTEYRLSGTYPDVIIDRQSLHTLEAQGYQMYNRYTGKMRRVIREGKYLVIPRKIFNIAIGIPDTHGVPRVLTTEEYQEIMSTSKHLCIN